MAQKLLDLYHEVECMFKVYTLFSILFMLTVFGGLSILHSVFSAIHEVKFASISILIVAYSIIPALLFVRSIDYTYKNKLKEKIK
jgi:hypothetical protein